MISTFDNASLLTEAFSPELLSRYGLRGDSLSEEQFEAIRTLARQFKTNKQGGVIRSLATLTSREPDQAAQILQHAQQLADLQEFNFDGSTAIAQATSSDGLAKLAKNYVSKFDQKSAQEAGDEFSVNDSPADWEDGRYKVFVAHNENDCIRYGQNKRYAFCISRRHDNYYHEYRAKHNASYYFVYDTGVSPYDPTHITVVAARADGTFEFTYANNSQDHRTRSLQGSLDKFLATKPGLEKARDLFVCKPLTDSESSNVAAAQAASPKLAPEQRRPFTSLTPEQQATFVHLGFLLSDEEYAQASPAIRDLYIARSHMLTDAQAAISTEAQRRRAATLYWRYNQVDKNKPAPWLQAYATASSDGTPETPVSSWPPAAHAVADWFGRAQAPGISKSQAASLIKESVLPLGPDLITHATPSAQREYLLGQLRAGWSVPENTLIRLDESVQTYYYEQCPRFNVRVPLERGLNRLATLAGIR